jgi:hypothetical protein
MHHHDEEDSTALLQNHVQPTKISDLVHDEQNCGSGTSWNASI